MLYFIDLEFIERGALYPIELISVGIVAEDGRELYLQSAEFDAEKASLWIKENVLTHLWNAYHSRAAIRQAILAFMAPDIYGKPELWGYYSSYDHVVFCQIFGTMMDLPKGFPMLTYDLRQWLDMRGMRDVRQPDDAPHHALEDARWIAETYKAYHEQ